MAIQTSYMQEAFGTKIERWTNIEDIFSCYSYISYKFTKCHRNRVMVLVFNSTFNNILAIALRSVLLIEETGVLRENLRRRGRQT